MNWPIAALLLAACLVGSASLASAAEGPASPALLGKEQPLASDQPIDITSDAAHVDEADRIVVLTGHVIAKQGEVALQADTVTVHYLAASDATKTAGDPSRGRIDRLDASGNVVVTRPGEIVKSTSAVYKMAERQILMTGHVVATRANNVVRGDSLIVDLANQMIKLDASRQSGRVEAIFTPPSSNGNP